MVNVCVPKKTPNICFGEIYLEQNLHWHFTVKKNNIKKHMPITSWHLISIIIAKNNKQNMFKMILRIEFIDTEITTMYKKLRCERRRYIFNGILKLEVTFNIISILLLYMQEYVYTSSPISKKCCF